MNIIIIQIASPRPQFPSQAQEANQMPKEEDVVALGLCIAQAQKVGIRLTKNEQLCTTMQSSDIER